MEDEKQEDPIITTQGIGDEEPIDGDSGPTSPPPPPPTKK